MGVLGRLMRLRVMMVMSIRTAATAMTAAAPTTTKTTKTRTGARTRTGNEVVCLDPPVAYVAGSIRPVRVDLFSRQPCATPTKGFNSLVPFASRIVLFPCKSRFLGSINRRKSRQNLKC